MPYFQHAAGHVQRLEDGDRNAVARQVARACQTGRPRSDNRGPLFHCASRRPVRRRRFLPAAAHRHIGHEPLQPPDRYRLELGAHHAGHLALRFLRADAPAHRRQRVGRLQNLVRTLDVLALQRRDEAWNIDTHGAAPARNAVSWQRRQRSASCNAPSSDSPSATFVEIEDAEFGRLVRHGRPLVRNGLEVLRPQRHRRSGFGFRQLASRNHRADRFDMRAQAGQLGGFAAEPFQRGLLLALETLLAQRQLVEIHQMAVEIGAVHAGEFHFCRPPSRGTIRTSRCHPP